MKRGSYIYAVAFLISLCPVFVFAQPAIPTGRAISVDEIIALAESFGGFLMVAGGVLAGIVIIWSGISYLKAGSDLTKVKSAKDILKAGLIGALIIFSVGIIIAIVRTLASDPSQFFT